MTVNSTTLKSGPYNTDGVTKDFPATFQYLEDSDIVVTLMNTTTGATYVGVLNTDFTVVDNVAPIIGGTVTIANNAFGGIASATGIIAAGYTITLNPSIPQLQQESYPNAGLFPSAAVEQALDRLTLIAQELQLGSNQSLKTPVTDSASITTTIPNATLRKAGGLGSYLFFSGVDGSPGVSSGLASVTVSTAMLPVVQAASLGVASELLLYGNIAGLTPAFVDTNVLEQSTANVNSYAQDITQNTNAGATASADIIVANNLTTATTFYGNFGMNSSGFTGSGAFNKASAVYLTSTSGDLAIGTTTANSIHFVYNNGTTDSAYIDSTGFNAVNVLSSGSMKLNGNPVWTQKLVTVVSTSGTFTRNVNTQFMDIEAWGGGGGGGGVAGSTIISIGAGGGAAGNYSKSTVNAATFGASQTVTIGAAGSAGASGYNAGGGGGTTSVGSLCVANGGGGGSGGSNAAWGIGGLAGAVGTGNVIANQGQNGFHGMLTTIAGLFAFSGEGGTSMVGGGGLSETPASANVASGQAASGYAAGGSGGASTNVAANTTGGVGTKGLVIITEYLSA